MQNRLANRRTALVLGLLCALWALPTPGQEASSVDRVLDAIVAQERELAHELRQFRPLVETYLQSVKTDAVTGSEPVSDRYLLGRLELGGGPAGENGKPRRSKDKMLDLYQYSAASNPEGFAKMMTLDAEAFDREHYRFEFVRREFLGEIRTLVFDVTPKPAKHAKPGRFTGRIWVEDEGYHIVRYNGLYGSIFKTNLHFDSWRLNMAQGLWLPAYVYTEESDRPGGKLNVKHKGQTRIWGYDVRQRNPEEEFTKVLVEAELTRDNSEDPGQISPVESMRAWEREAEDNVIRRLRRAGLLAPEGEVSRVLETVVANLELTNDLEIYPPVRCRVLMTTPLESFTVGHTIILSRGLIDVLPDEASLALMLAHELGHILSGHRLDTRYAFGDEVLVGDKEALEEFLFRRDPAEESSADEVAVRLLENSPYKDDLGNAGLFLKELAARAQALPTLIRPHFGNRMASKDRLTRLAAIVEGSPELDPTAIDQISALPLGGRVKVDPWSARVELMKNNRVALLSAREKMPFQLTPLMPYLTRYNPAREATGDPLDVESAEALDERIQQGVAVHEQASADSD